MRPRNVYRELSLRNKFALWTTVGVLGVVASLTSLSLWTLQHDLTRSATEAQAALIDNVAKGLDEKIELRRTALTLHSAVLGRRLAFHDVAALEEYFVSRPLLTSLFDVLLVADTSGRLVYDLPHQPARRGLSIADRDYFQQVMKTGRSVISQPLPGKSTGQAVVNFAVPLRGNAGEISAVLIGVIYLNKPNFLGTLGTTRIGREGYFALMTTGPTPLTVMHAQPTRIMKPVPVAENPHVAQALNGFEGTVDDADSRGLEALFSYRSLASVPWVLTAVYPTAEAYATLRERTRESLVIGLLMAVMSGAVTWLLAAHLLRPLRRLQEVMESYRLNPDAPIETIDVRSKDVAALASAYAELMRHRQHAEAALRHSERRLRAVADNLPALVSYLDKTETYRFVNAHYGPFFGIDPQSLVGRTLRQTLGEDSYDGIKTQVAAVLRGTPQQFERTRPGLRGIEHLMVSYTPDVNADGAVDGYYVMAMDITARKNAELRQTLSERRLKAVTDNLPAVISYIDAGQRYTFVNGYVRRAFGLDPASTLGRTLQEVFSDTVYADILPHARQALAGEEVHFERSVEVNGRMRHFRSGYVPDRDEHGVVQGFYAMTFDETERKSIELRLAHKQHMLRLVTDNLPMLISYVDRAHNLRFANGTFKTWLNIDPAQAIDRPLCDVIGATVYEARRAPLLRALAGERCEFEVDMTSAGTGRQLKNTYIPDLQPDGSIPGVFTLSVDITAMKAAQRQLEAMARVDALTGLPNRRQFDEKLFEALARARRDGRPMALMFLDIDHFKSINDSLGHAAGDAVLREFGARVKLTIRSTDVVARLAGDEFVVLLEGIHSNDEPVTVAQKIIDAVRVDFSIADRPLKVTTSLGVALAIDSGVSAEQLLSCADEALYKAKKAGRNGFRLLPCTAELVVAAIAAAA